jgi:hypothetical protein
MLNGPVVGFDLALIGGEDQILKRVLSDAVEILCADAAQTSQQVQIVAHQFQHHHRRRRVRPLAHS